MISVDNRVGGGGDTAREGVFMYKTRITDVGD